MIIFNYITLKSYFLKIVWKIKAQINMIICNYITLKRYFQYIIFQAKKLENQYKILDELVTYIWKMIFIILFCDDFLNTLSYLYCTFIFSFSLLLLSLNKKKKYLSVLICNHPFVFIFVPKCKSLFKLLDVFIIFFLNIALINTTNLSWNLKSQI